MNYKDRATGSTPGREQARRLRQLIAEVVGCCQERVLFEAKRFDLPPAELKGLMLFRGERYLTAKTLAARLEVGKSRVTKIVSGLVARGLIEILDDPRDGRVKLLTPTKAGLEKMDRIEEFVIEVHGRLLEQMEPPQRTTVLAALELLHSAMEAVKLELKIG